MSNHNNGNKIHFPFDPESEEVSIDDSEALEEKGKNPLEEEEKIEEDDTGSD